MADANGSKLDNRFDTTSATKVQHWQDKIGLVGEMATGENNLKGIEPFWGRTRPVSNIGKVK